MLGLAKEFLLCSPLPEAERFLSFLKLVNDYLPVLSRQVSPSKGLTEERLAAYRETTKRLLQSFSEDPLYCAGLTHFIRNFPHCRKAAIRASLLDEELEDLLAPHLPALGLFDSPE